MRWLTFRAYPNLSLESAPMVGQNRSRNSEVSYIEPNTEEAAVLMRVVAKKDR